MLFFLKQNFDKFLQMNWRLLYALKKYAYSLYEGMHNQNRQGFYQICLHSNDLKELAQAHWIPNYQKSLINANSRLPQCFLLSMESVHDKPKGASIVSLWQLQQITSNSFSFDDKQRMTVIIF